MDTFLGALWQLTGSYIMVRDVLFTILLLIILCEGISFFVKDKTVEISAGFIFYAYPALECSCWLLRISIIDWLIKPGQIADTPGWQFIYDIPKMMEVISNFLKISGQIAILAGAVLAIMLLILLFFRKPIRKFILGSEKEGISLEQLEKENIIAVDTPQRMWRMLLIAIPIFALSIGFAFYCKSCYENYTPKEKPQTTACIQAVVSLSLTQKQLTK